MYMSIKTLYVLRKINIFQQKRCISLGKQLSATMPSRHDVEYPGVLDCPLSLVQLPIVPFGHCPIGPLAHLAIEL